MTLALTPAVPTLPSTAPAAPLELLPSLEAVAARSPAAPALLAPGREPVCFADLVAQIQTFGSRLRSLGFASGDRIGLAMPDSPEAAQVMLAAIAYCAAVPVDPRATPAEVERQLESVGARAVVVAEEGCATARAAAQAAGVPVLELRPQAGAVAGKFQLEVLAPETTDPADPPDPADSAGLADPATAATASPHAASLVVVMPGMSGFPKIIPLTQYNLLSSVLADCEVLGLTPLDRCLGVTPLWHIHGLGALLCALLSGGSVVVMPGFTPDSFFDALGRCAPTWFTASPAVHRQVLDRAPLHESTIRTVAECKALRFIRSGSAGMPGGVPERLEQLFNTVYVEARGATEASGSVCSNRPGRGRIGSVGLPMPGTEVRVVDAAGRPVGTNAEGELVVRGPGVFGGYEGNPAATAAAFVDGFFRTGDLARRDGDGFFHLVGRVDDRIDRDGVPVSPYEVEDALLTHRDVVQAVAIGIPDPILGQEVGAAVVLRERAPILTELELQRHVSPFLSDHKVPRRVVFLDEIPVGPNGKLSRRRLAGQLGLTMPAPTPAVELTASPYNDPVTPTEQALASIWSEVLGRRVGDVDAPFEVVGIDSLQALGICLAVERRVGRVLPPAALATRRTIRSAAALLESDGWRPAPGAPVVLREGRPVRPVLFVVPGVEGNTYGYAALAQHLPQWQRVVALPLPGADGLEGPLDSADAVAERLAAAILREQPRGPYVLCGDALGGYAAFETARRLTASGGDVKLVALVDTPAPGWPPPLKPPERVSLTEALRRAASLVLGPATAEAAGDGAEWVPPFDAAGSTGWREAFAAAYKSAFARWRPGPLNVRLLLPRCESTRWTDCDVSDLTMGWTPLTPGGVDVMTLPGGHDALLRGPNASQIAGRLATLIEALGFVAPPPAPPQPQPDAPPVAAAPDGIGPGGGL